MATTAGITYLADLRLRAREECDRVNSQFVTDPELNTYINQSSKDYYDLLTQQYDDDYILDPTQNIFSFTTDGVSEFYTLPDNFYKLAFCVVSPNNLLTTRCLVPRFTMGESTQLLIPNIPIVPYFGIATFRHKIVGNKIWLLPPPAAGQTIMLYWYPRMQDLRESGSLTLQNLVPGDSNVTVNGTTLVYGDANWAVGGSDYAGALNLNSYLNNNSVALGILTASVPVSGTPIINVGIQNSAVTWLTTSTGSVKLSPVPSSLNPGTPTWTDQLDGYNGWTEFVVVDAAMKMVIKEESDPAPFFARRALLVQRLQTMMKNRNAGIPKHVTRTRNQSWSWGPGGAGMFPGGGW